MSDGDDRRLLQVMSPSGRTSGNPESSEGFYTPDPRMLARPPARTETTAYGRDTSIQTGSPTKEQLKSEIYALNLHLRGVEHEARAYYEQQRAKFRICAESYAAEAKEINRVEIAQTEAMAMFFYHSNMNLRKCSKSRNGRSANQPDHRGGISDGEATSAHNF